MISLSTPCTPIGSPLVVENLRRAREAGFRLFELRPNQHMPTAETLMRLAEELDIGFSSVHNITDCGGLDEEEDMGDGLASADASVRARAVEGTVRTIELARALGAGGVVIHGGNVPVENKIERFNHARKLYEAGRRQEARDLTARVVEERNAIARPHVETLIESLREVLEKGGDFPLGLECRMKPYSIPFPSEAEFVMEALSDRPIYYWHDVGHAVINERLGVRRAHLWLERFDGRTLGFHIHDVRGLKDHLPPGTGEVDFAALRPYFKEGVIRVMELGSGSTLREYREAAALLEGL